MRIWDGSSLSHPRHPGFESQVEFRPSRLGHNGAQRTKLDPPQKETEREIKDGRSEKESRAPKRAKKRGIAKEKKSGRQGGEMSEKRRKIDSKKKKS